MIGGVVVKSIVNISNRGSNIENRTENLKYVSSHPSCYYFVGKSLVVLRYIWYRGVVIWPGFNQNNMTNTKFEKIFPNFEVVHRTTAVIIFGSPTKFLVVLELLDYHYYNNNYNDNKSIYIA